MARTVEVWAFQIILLHVDDRLCLHKKQNMGSFPRKGT